MQAEVIAFLAVEAPLRIPVVNIFIIVSPLILNSDCLERSLFNDSLTILIKASVTAILLEFMVLTHVLSMLLIAKVAFPAPPENPFANSSMLTVLSSFIAFTKPLTLESLTKDILLMISIN